MSDPLSRGHLEPSHAGAPSLVLLHEWWGLNEHLRSVAARFAGAGFTVFAADLYGGQVAHDEAAAERLMRDLEQARVALTLRAQASPRVAVAGYCLGGALALAAAEHPFDACVTFYGLPDAEEADVSRIRAPVLGHFATHDDWCPPSRVDALQQQLLPGATLHRYEAQHAFCNDTRPEVYQPVQAGLAFQRTVTFLHAQPDAR